ncbi:MAG TPA: cysteine desulfurase [Candidatus Limosilactobacillus merdigallinarum]|uniref:cysteine desulfurase n=1 Tax=Candidatus Limosilactobacillus merdigallinarum TaxID=2838652 RepID=A0A9D1VHT4_9LACO|nr:cysteine desulfurase [Candidatus Limosilactobacillus merdigallinarum]
MDKHPVYLDNAGTTPMMPETIQAWTDAANDSWGNASTTNYYGRIAKQALEDSRHAMAQSINAASDEEIVITSGGTESDNTVIYETARARQKLGKHIITTKFEHEAILRPLEDLAKNEGFDVTYLDVDENGQIDLQQLKDALTDDTILVSIMTVNNEVGSHLPIHEIGEIVKDSNAWFHTDAVQGYGAVPIDVQKDHIDFLSTSAHKINGPKGIGFLYRREGLNLPSLIRGGDQELKRRAGTENVPQAVSFAKAIELHFENDQLQKNADNYWALKKQLVQGLRDHNIDFELNGSFDDHMTPQTMNIWFKGVRADALLTDLDLAGVVAAAGSACTAGSLDPSHVLVAMYGKDSPRVSQSLRISLGMTNSSEDIDRLIAVLADLIPKLKAAR